MSSNKDIIDSYVYNKYINHILYKHECGLIEDDKISQLLNTLEIWEARFKKLSLVEKNNLRFALQELT